MILFKCFLTWSLDCMNSLGCMNSDCRFDDIDSWQLDLRQLDVWQFDCEGSFWDGSDEVFGDVKEAVHRRTEIQDQVQ